MPEYNWAQKRMQGWADGIYCPQPCFGSINLNIFSPPLPIEISSNNYSKCIINSSSKRQDQLSRLMSPSLSFLQCPRRANRSLLASCHAPRSYFTGNYTQAAKGDWDKAFAFHIACKASACSQEAARSVPRRQKSQTNHPSLPHTITFSPCLSVLSSLLAFLWSP